MIMNHESSAHCCLSLSFHFCSLHVCFVSLSLVLKVSLEVSPWRVGEEEGRSSRRSTEPLECVSVFNGERLVWKHLHGHRSRSTDLKDPWRRCEKNVHVMLQKHGYCYRLGLISRTHLIFMSKVKRKVINFKNRFTLCVCKIIASAKCLKSVLLWFPNITPACAYTCVCGLKSN